MIPRVSIIIPVYNVEPYIVECLQSVTNQTVANEIECIIVDDRGTDNSMEVVTDWLVVNDYKLENDYYQHRDSLTTNQKSLTIKIITREKNGGLSAARNSGIMEAKGEYLYFLDSDDYLVPTAMETLLYLADKHGGVDLLPALYITDKGHEMSQFVAHSFPEFSDNQHQIKRALLDYDRIPVTAANRLVRRELIFEHDLFFKEGIIHEDNYWTFFLAKHVKRMGFCPEKIYYYRTTEGSITKSPNMHKEALAFQTMITDFSENIDIFEVGAQKRLIFLNVLTMWRSHWYKTKDDATSIITKFEKTNTLFERILLWCCLIVTFSCFINTKFINLLQRVYLMQK